MQKSLLWLKLLNQKSWIASRIKSETDYPRNAAKPQAALDRNLPSKMWMNIITQIGEPVKKNLLSSFFLPCLNN
jgi:hypothetical protein